MNPTDLDIDEERYARRRLRELAEEFAGDGVLRDPRLRDAFEQTWRHPYVPAYYPDKDGPPVLCIDGDRRAEWLETVYSDVTLLTKIVRTPLSAALLPATENAFTSSSTLPHLVVMMLEALDLRDGQNVLEIGTGTGYNAALLCARMGDSNVTTVDIDPELVGLAQARLAANGHAPTVVAADGALGYAANAPYDRIISTCSVRKIPQAWLSQVTEGSVILADVHGPLGGTLAKLVVQPDLTAVGRFMPRWIGFMAMRGPHADRRDRSPLLDQPLLDAETHVDPQLIAKAGPFSFLLQWYLPDITFGYTTGLDGRPAMALMADDGNYAEIDLRSSADGSFSARESGTGRILARLEAAAQFWREHDEPGSDQFGITASPHEQYVWFESPDGPRWPLV